MESFETSDTHWKHGNILDFHRGTRPIAGPELMEFFNRRLEGDVIADEEKRRYFHLLNDATQEMDELMIAGWNSVVSYKDHTYHLGDFSFGDEEYTRKLLGRLNGKKFLILGNHDKIMKTHSVSKKFEWVKDYHELRGFNNKSAIPMFHYPLRSWNRSHHGAVMLHGHAHCTVPNVGRGYDVGIDGNFCSPYHLPPLIDDINKIPPPERRQKR